MSYVETLPANSTTSLQRDIAEGKPNELDYWNGSMGAARMSGKCLDPVNEFIY
jgi:2-dehydropantoate 2-reductase